VAKLVLNPRDVAELISREGVDVELKENAIAQVVEGFKRKLIVKEIDRLLSEAVGEAVTNFFPKEWDGRTHTFKLKLPAHVTAIIHDIVRTTAKELYEADTFVELKKIFRSVIEAEMPSIKSQLTEHFKETIQQTVRAELRSILAQSNP
jgi:hypothetical protein